MTWVLVFYLSAGITWGGNILAMSGTSNLGAVAPYGQRVEVIMPDRATCEKIAALNTNQNAECWAKLEKHQ